MNNLNDVLYTLLCTVRLLVFTPLILTALAFIPIMYALGVSDPRDVWITLNQRLVFNYKEQEDEI